VHEQILRDELPILVGLGGDPPTGSPAPASNPTGHCSARWRRDTRRRQTIGCISRLLWRSLKDASRGRAQIWRAAITVAEPIGAAFVRLTLRKFVSRPAQ
jgi:hypothetical protein